MAGFFWLVIAWLPHTTRSPGLKSHPHWWTVMASQPPNRGRAKPALSSKRQTGRAEMIYKTTESLPEDQTENVH